MIFKKTRPTRSLANAVRWVRSYQDESVKNAGKGEISGAIQPGRDYHTDRPPGAITAHGFLKDLIGESMRIHRIPEKQAIIRFLVRYDAALKRKRRKILGLRGVFSIDPALLPTAAKHQVDLEKLMIESVEKTARKISENYYGGQEVGFFLGMHHDRHHLHGHLFALPYTSADKRICWSNRDWPFAKAAANPADPKNLLIAWSETYRRVVAMDIAEMLQRLDKAPPELERRKKVRNAHLMLGAHLARRRVAAENPPTSREAKDRLLISRFAQIIKTGTAQKLLAACDRSVPELSSKTASELETRCRDYLKARREDYLNIRTDHYDIHQDFIDKLSKGRGQSTFLPSGDCIWDSRPEPAMNVSEEDEETFFRGLKEPALARRITALAFAFQSLVMRWQLTGKEPAELALLKDSLRSGEAPYYDPSFVGTQANPRFAADWPGPSPEVTRLNHRPENPMAGPDISF